MTTAWRQRPRTASLPPAVAGSCMGEFHRKCTHALYALSSTAPASPPALAPGPGGGGGLRGLEDSMARMTRAPANIMAAWRSQTVLLRGRKTRARLGAGCCCEKKRQGSGRNKERTDLLGSKREGKFKSTKPDGAVSVTSMSLSTAMGSVKEARARRSSVSQKSPTQISYSRHKSLARLEA